MKIKDLISQFKEMKYHELIKIVKDLMNYWL